jgi:choloylglycine hydrolase
MCTSLIYRDAAGRAYFGRTLELTADLPYLMTWFPAGFATTSRIEGHPALSFTTVNAVLAVTMPIRVPAKGAPLDPADLKALEGVNAHGLTFSLLSYPSAAGPQAAVAEAGPCSRPPTSGSGRSASSPPWRRSKRRWRPSR